MLRARLTTEMKEAMKAGDKDKLATVRMIQAALKDKDIEARGLGKEPASDEEILSLLQKMIKQRTESATVYEQGGR
ncbi:GatB/YqeY domain-containing protein, partial [Enterococcus faecalis]|nr:GatB/YqeY domain-containing protein [Enterococcus faecalis]